MNRIAAFSATVAGLLLASSAFAQGAAPAGSTGVCKDGSYSTAQSRQGACRGHKGVKEWFSESAATTAKPAPVAATTAASAPAAASPAVATTMKPTAPAAPVAAKPAAYTPPAMAAPGGGAGQVWVNKSSKVYHCQGDKWYGKTKDGAYMSEAAATAAGYHGDHGKSCKS